MTDQKPQAVDTAENLAYMLHDDVTYGGGRKMSDQVERVAALVTESLQHQDTVDGTDVNDVIIAAYLHKALETKRINPNYQGLITLEMIEQTFGSTVANVIDEISSEPPEPEGQDKMELWADKSDWALSLSVPSQIILLAEKVANFETSRDDPNPSWPVSRHREYYESRLLMVDALKTASPELHDLAYKVMDEGLEALSKLEGDDQQPDVTPPNYPAPPYGSPPSAN